MAEPIKPPAPAASTSPRPAAEQQAPSEKQKKEMSADERAAKDAQEAADRQTKFVDETAEKINALVRDENLTNTQRDIVLDQIVKKVRSIRTVAASSMNRIGSQAIRDLEAEHAPFTTPPAPIGDVGSRNIVAQQEHLENKENK